MRLMSIYTSTVVAGLLASGFAVSIAGVETELITSTPGRIVQVQVKLKTPKDGRDKRVARPLDEVSCSMFIPQGSGTLRGALFNPFYEDTVRQQHWRTAVNHWGFALIGTNLFRVRNDEIGLTVRNALNQLAKAGGHPEVSHFPLCVLGMSIGAGLTTRIVEAMPERVITAAPVCLEVGPRDAASERVPMITIFGEKDGRQMEKLTAKLPEARRNGAQWAIAVQWGQRHEWYRANNLVMPLFDRAIAKRYPASASPLDGPVQLIDYDPKNGWLGDIGTWHSQCPTIAPAGKTTIPAGRSCWLPDHYVASVWQAFVAKEPRIKIITPAGQGDGKPFAAYSSGSPISVTLAADPTCKTEHIDLYDGSERIGRCEGDPPNCVIKGLEAGVHALIARVTTSDGRQICSHPNTIVVVEPQ